MITIKRMLPHLCILLAGMFITFFAVDQFNSAMSVLGNNPLAKALLLLFSVTSVIVSGILIHKQRQE